MRGHSAGCPSALNNLLESGPTALLDQAEFWTARLGPPPVTIGEYIVTAVPDLRISLEEGMFRRSSSS